MQVDSAAGAAPQEQATRVLVARSLLRDRVSVFALAILAVVVVSAIGAEVLAPHDPLRQDLSMRNMPPLTAAKDGLPHLLGTDPLGRDVLSRLMHGARVSMLVGLLTVLVAGTLGVTVGVLAGYYRGWVDDLVMRLVDLQMSFPFLLLALLVLLVLGPGFLNLILVLTLVRWMIYARVARGMTLVFRESAFVEAARTIGCSDVRIIARHIVPNLASPLLILATLEIAALILGEAALSFLGFGLQPPNPSWGSMIENGRQYITTAWWLVTFPGLAIFLTALSLNLLAASLRSVTDPVHRWRWLSTGRQGSSHE